MGNPSKITPANIEYCIYSTSELNWAFMFLTSYWYICTGRTLIGIYLIKLGVDYIHTVCSMAIAKL